MQKCSLEWAPLIALRAPNWALSQIHIVMLQDEIAEFKQVLSEQESVHKEEINQMKEVSMLTLAASMSA